MAGFFDLTEQGLLDYFIATYGGTTKWIGLTSTTPAEAASGITEPTIGTGAYARVSTTTSDWSAATGAAPATKTTTATKTFPTATADWAAGANMVAFVLYGAITGGTALAYGLLTVPKPVLLGDTASFAAGSLVIKLGDNGDPF